MKTQGITASVERKGNSITLVGYFESPEYMETLTLTAEELYAMVMQHRQLVECGNKTLNAFEDRKNLWSTQKTALILLNHAVNEM